MSGFGGEKADLGFRVYGAPGGRLCGEGADRDQVVGEHAVSDPGPGAFETADPAAVPAVAAFEVADPAFASGPPFDGAAERFSVFFGASILRGLPLRGISTFLTPTSVSCWSTAASP